MSDLLAKEALLKSTVAEIADRLSREYSKLLPEDAFTAEEKEKFARMFANCYVSTANTTTKFLPDGETYVFTGDIEAMWLRDSSAQVVHYLPFLKEQPVLKSMVAGLIERQMRYIVIDPYANAYNEEENGKCWAKDETDSNDWEWERKYEIDSLCYPLWLLHNYIEKTGDKSVLTPTVHEAMKTIVQTWITEQHHGTESTYRFVRNNSWALDNVPCGGKGNPVADTGMTWCAFRPSDDSCKYGYLVPSNMFASVVLNYVVDYASELGDKELAEKAAKLKDEIAQGIENYAVRNLEGVGETYVYETDGFGNDLWMDDANVPSLLSMPWLGWCEKDDERYQNTRKWILSAKNPYYFEGTKAKGIGSPHTEPQYVWHIALCMQGLTSDCMEEKTALLQTLIRTDGGREVMHESFDCNAPEKFSREWFAWANSLFALFAMDYCNSLKEK
ncbi:MAG: glycoside hydrolase family 125 protein [Lachnospiraceae bacterium]|nr:glycoside hydrolase family 125 protein [Lachnospiraceae bacterium]